MNRKHFLSAVIIVATVSVPAFALVTGQDNRAQVCPTCASKPTATPFNTMGRIKSYFADGTVGYGSGTLISRHHVLTAAHVVYQGNHSGMAYKIEFEAQRYGATPTYTAYASIPLSYVPNDYKVNNPGDATNFIADFAVLNLDRPIGSTTGWMDVEAYESYLQTYPGPGGALPLLNLAGYPADRPNPGSAAVPKGTALYISGGEVDQVTINFLRFNHEDECSLGSCIGADWAEGQSGGAIWINDIRDTQRHIVGVVSSHNTNFNQGLKISDSILSTIASHMGTAVVPGRGIVGNDATASIPPDRPDFADYDALYGTTTAAVEATMLSYDSALVASIKIANTGTLSGNTAVSYFLSADPEITADDLHLASYPVTVSAFSAATSPFYYQLGGIAPGEYYFGWMIDVLNNQQEYVESDNAGRFSGTITIAPRPGDFNADGFVDAADYVVWRKSEQAPEGYLAWQENFGKGTIRSGNIRQQLGIPEPATFLLVLISAVFIRVGRTKR